MTRLILTFVMFVGFCSQSLWAQGPACRQYNTWFISTNAGNDPSHPVYFPSPEAMQGMEQLQAQYGGVGPICDAEWLGPQGVNSWSGGCRAIGWTCPPPAPSLGVCPSCNTAGKPIDLGTGNTYMQATDVRLPGLGLGLTLSRTWNSLGGSSGSMFGPGWISTYEEQLIVGSDGLVMYQRADGSRWWFAFYGNPPTFQLISPADHQATLSEQGPDSQGNATWTMTFQNGETRTFTVNPLFVDANNHYQNNNAVLATIADRNGNKVTLNYNTQQQNGQTVLTSLNSVTDAVGRHLYFNYPPGAALGPVASVTSDPGRGINVTYSYTSSPTGSTMTVTQADGTFVTYNYDTFARITSVTDTNGKVLEAHTYDGANRGLSSSQANGVNNLTVAYPSAP